MKVVKKSRGTKPTRKAKVNRKSVKGSRPAIRRKVKTMESPTDKLVVYLGNSRGKLAIFRSPVSAEVVRHREREKSAAVRALNFAPQYGRLSDEEVGKQLSIITGA